MFLVRFVFMASFIVVCAVSAQNTTTAQYIDAYKGIAMQEMRKHGIPASITLAQGILESASGNSKLAKDCNNHFGIKCRKNWTAKFCLADDDAPNECFRGYETADESYHDHSLFLKENSRYATLFSYAVTDYSSWAHGLRTAGYATNPAYGSSLIAVIEKHRLAAFDSMVVLGADYVPVGISAVATERTVNGLPAVVVVSGQTAESIAKDQEMAAWQIYKYNDLKRGERIQPGDIVYLKPKRRSADIPVHVVREGENIRSISQLHGIKLKHIYKKNDLKPGQLVKAGDILYLQKKRTEQKSASNPSKADTTAGKTAKIGEKTNSPTISQNEESAALFHLVNSGETLYYIARKYRVTVEDLIEWNSLKSNTIKSGQKLALQKSSLDETDEGEGKIEPIKRNAAVVQRKSHTVQKGETLYQISRKYSISVENLKKINGVDGNSIFPGQRLFLQPE